MPQILTNPQKKTYKRFLFSVVGSEILISIPIIKPRKIDKNEFRFHFLLLAMRIMLES